MAISFFQLASTTVRIALLLLRFQICVTYVCVLCGAFCVSSLERTKIRNETKEKNVLKIKVFCHTKYTVYT